MSGKIRLSDEEFKKFTDDLREALTTALEEVFREDETTDNVEEQEL